MVVERTRCRSEKEEVWERGEFIMGLGSSRRSASVGVVFAQAVFT